MEVPLPIKFTLRLVGGERIEFTSNLLQYFELFGLIVEDAVGYDETSREHVFIEAPTFQLEKPLWLFIRDVYTEHDEIYGAEEGPTVPIQHDQSRHIRAIQLYDLYRLLRILNYYGAPLMLDFVARQLLSRLILIPRTDLFLAHPRVEPQSEKQLEKYLFQPIEWLAKPYHLRRLDLHHIFETYVQTHDIIEYMERTFFPHTTHVLASSMTGSLLVMTQRGLYGFGNNHSGELGLGAFEQSNEWRKIPVENPISVWMGVEHSMVLTVAGLMVFGSNKYGQLGIRVEEEKKEDEVIRLPRQLPIYGVLSAACGAHHTLIHTSHGVYACGRGHNGQLGIGLRMVVREPKEVAFKGKAVAVACGSHFSLILDDAGQVFGFGANQMGQLAQDPKAFPYFSVPMKLEVPERAIMTAISGGDQHTLFLGNKGEVYAVGSNQYGQLGLGIVKRGTVMRLQRITTLRTPIVAICACQTWSLFIDAHGDVYGCGENGAGQLGLGLSDSEERWLPVKIPLERDNQKVLSVAGGLQYSVFLTCEALFIAGPHPPNMAHPPPKRFALQIVTEPICPTLVVANADEQEEGEPKSKKQRSLSCHYCGCSDESRLGYHTASQRLFCMKDGGDCFAKYNTIPIL